MAPKTGSKKLVETWRPERDLDCMVTHMDPHPGYTLQQLWDDAEPYISQKVTRSRDVTEHALHHTCQRAPSSPQCQPAQQPFRAKSGQTKSRRHSAPERCLNAASDRRVGADTMRKQSSCYPRETTRRPTCIISAGRRSYANSNSLGPTTRRGTNLGRPTHGNSWKRSRKFLTTTKRFHFGENVTDHPRGC